MEATNWLGEKTYVHGQMKTNKWLVVHCLTIVVYISFSVMDW